MKKPEGTTDQRYGAGTDRGSDAHPCEGCRHWYGAYVFARCCNYIFDIGHRRPCPFGAGCTVKRPVEDGDGTFRRKGKELL